MEDQDKRKLRRDDLVDRIESTFPGVKIRVSSAWSMIPKNPPQTRIVKLEEAPEKYHQEIEGKLRVIWTDDNGQAWIHVMIEDLDK